MTHNCICPLTKNPEPSLTRLTAAIADVRTWMINNKLKINDDKTEFFILSSSRATTNENLPLHIGSSVIHPVSSAKNLGFIFDNNLKMNKQISAVSRTCTYQLRNISMIRHLLTDNATAQLIHSLVSSRLDYCNSLLYGLPASSIRPLQRVQNMAARILSKTTKYDHITPVLRSLHWLPLKHRILFKVLLFTYRALSGLAPPYLCDLLIKHEPKRKLRSNGQQLLSVPRSFHKNTGDRTFAVAAPTEWNKLPLEIRQSSSLCTFKTKLKTHLFKQYLE